jgi:beta-lactamase regulating signal transducer with metallopeptidase domain
MTALLPLIPLIPLIVDVLIKATALVAVAALADAALARRGSAAARHFVWALTMTMLLALPVAIVALPHWQVRIPVERAALAGAAQTLGAAPAAFADPAPPAATVDAERAPMAPDRARRPIAALAVASLVLLYVMGVVLLLARLASEPLALRRLARDARPVTDGEWRPLLDRCVEAMAVRRPVALLHSGREVMPLTFGTLTPTIVLPASAPAWNDDRRAAVLLHELAHVARRDCLSQRVSALACALYWPHPGVWLGARRLRVERELACDDRVLAAGAAARDYAGHLLDLAHSLGRAPAPATALGMARPHQLERRLLAILDAARNRATLGRHGLTAALAATVVLVSMAGLRAAIVPVDRFEPPALSGAAPAMPSGGAGTAQDAAGTWELRRTQDPGTVQITIRTEHGSHGRTIATSSLAGLPVDQIDAANATVRFPIRREAGTFTVDGVCRRGVCAGTYTFQADPAFADALVTRGIGRPTPQDQFALAIADVGGAYFDALAQAGYAKPDLASVVRAAQHGVDLAYLRGMSALGHRVGTLDALIQLRDHGVDPTYIRGMESLGYTGLDATALTGLRDHGVDPSFIRGMQEAGYAHLSLDDLRNARDHGADPVYAREMAALGFARLPLPELISARDHGVDQVYIRDMQRLGHRLSLDEYRQTRDHGVDPPFISGLAALGYKGLSVAALITTRDHGVDPAYVRGMADAGYKGIALDDLVRMRDHGVDPDYVRRVQKTGAPHLSVDEIIQRRDRGEPDPDAAVRAVASKLQYYLAQISRWLRS